MEREKETRAGCICMNTNFIPNNLTMIDCEFSQQTHYKLELLKEFWIQLLKYILW